MDVTANIKAIRMAKGIKQADLSRLLDIDPHNYPKFEKRGEKLTIENLAAIGKALGVTVVDILTWGEQKPEAGGTSEHVRALETELERLKGEVDRLAAEEVKSGKLLRYQEEELDYYPEAIAKAVVDMAVWEFYKDDANRGYFPPTREGPGSPTNKPGKWSAFLDEFLSKSDAVSVLKANGLLKPNLLEKYRYKPETVPMPYQLHERIQRNYLAYRQSNPTTNQPDLPTE